MFSKRQAKWHTLGHLIIFGNVPFSVLLAVLSHSPSFRGAMTLICGNESEKASRKLSESPVTTLNVCLVLIFFKYGKR